MLGYASLKREGESELKEGKMGKKLEQIDPIEYGISGKELVAAAAVKAYLQVLPPQMAATQLSQAIKPKIIQIYERDAHCLPQLLDSLIDGKNLAGLIHRSLSTSAWMLGKQEFMKWDGESKVLTALSGIEGREIIESMSDGLLWFFADCYRVLVYNRSWG